MGMILTISAHAGLIVGSESHLFSVNSVSRQLGTFSQWSYMLIVYSEKLLMIRITCWHIFYDLDSSKLFKWMFMMYTRSVTDIWARHKMWIFTWFRLGLSVLHWFQEKPNGVSTGLLCSPLFCPAPSHHWAGTEMMLFWETGTERGATVLHAW